MQNLVSPQNFEISAAQWIALGPSLILTVGILMAMLIATVSFSGENRKLPLLLFSGGVLISAGIWAAVFWNSDRIEAFGGMLVFDHFTSFFTVLLVFSTVLVMMASYSYLEEAEIHFSEFYPLMLCSLLGMILLSASNELLSLFIALELMSLTVYVLVGLRRSSALSNEASIKYFIMGGVGAAIFLYGVALVYGALNSTRLSVIGQMLLANGALLDNPILVAGIAMILVGFLFKVAAVPFHTWTPDVYEGAPTNVTSFMATALKVAVFAAFIRISVGFIGNGGTPALGAMQPLIEQILWWLALSTMVVGNFVALMQSNLKRLMAYSAIAHTGYLLVGILAGAKVGYAGLLVYLVAYAAMNIGAFALMALFAGKDDRGLTVNGLIGLGKSHPWVAAALTVFLLSLGGFPPTAGFLAKYYLFSGALSAGYVGLVLIGVLTSAVSVAYYLRLVVMMYMREGAPPTYYRPSYLAFAAVAICVILVLNFGLFPAGLIQFSERAVQF
jgi:NADH-quinone oxidoreductase subunit N